jgi:hypothetical protein
MEQPEQISNYKLLRHLIALDLPPNEFKLATILVVMHRSETTLQCTPTQRTLAKEMGLKPTNHGTVGRITKTLREKGVFDTIRVVMSDRSPFKLPTQYCFLFDLDQAIEWAENANGEFKGSASTLDDYKCVKEKTRCQSHPTYQK